MSATNGVRPGWKAIEMHDGGPLNADPNGNRAQRRAAAKLALKGQPTPETVAPPTPDEDVAE